MKLRLLFAATLLFSIVDVSATEKTYDIITSRHADIYGNVHDLGISNKRALPVVLVFLESGCTISQRMIPALNAL